MNWIIWYKQYIILYYLSYISIAQHPFPRASDSITEIK